jgi:hypothetical protein
MERGMLQAGKGTSDSLHGGAIIVWETENAKKQRSKANGLEESHCWKTSTWDIRGSTNRHRSFYAFWLLLPRSGNSRHRLV